MKLRTHYVFSTGLLTFLDSVLFHEYFYYALILSGMVSVIGNSLIDRIGHKEVATRYGYIPVRTPLTHTIPRSVVWGIVSIIPVFILLLIYYGFSYHEYYFSLSNKVLMLILLNGELLGPPTCFLMYLRKGEFTLKGTVDGGGLHWPTSPMITVCPYTFISIILCSFMIKCRDLALNHLLVGHGTPSSPTARGSHLRNHSHPFGHSPHQRERSSLY